MNNVGFYVFAVIAVVVAVYVLKHLVTCLMRTVVVVLLLLALAVAYYLLVGQYDPEIHSAVEHARQAYPAS